MTAGTAEQNYDAVYCYSNGTLKNKLGIADRKKLDILADRSANIRRAEIMSLRKKKIEINEAGWNEEMLKDIHRALMGDIYEWGGKYRTVDVGIAYDHVAYVSPDKIEGELKKVFDYINENNCFRGMSDGELIQAYSLVFGNLKNIQPFRDGNTRTAMVFTQLLAGAAGMTIDFDFFGSDIDRKTGREGSMLNSFREAQVKARDGNYNDLAMCFVYMVAPDYERPELMMPRVRIGYQGNLLETLRKVTGDAPVTRTPMFSERELSGKTK